MNVTGLADNIIDDVDVTLNISHTYDSDLQIRLTSPAGTTITLVYRRGGSGNHFSNTVFNDSAPISILSGSAPFSNASGYKPQGGALANFIGQAANGNWTLSIRNRRVNVGCRRAGAREQDCFSGFR